MLIWAEHRRSTSLSGPTGVGARTPVAAGRFINPSDPRQPTGPASYSRSDGIPAPAAEPVADVGVGSAASTGTGGRTQGSLAPFPRYLRTLRSAGLGGTFSTRSPGPPPPLTTSLPRAPLHRMQRGPLVGASGTGRTIGQRHQPSSNVRDGSPPAYLGDPPGQRIAGFPTAGNEFRRSSALRSAANRSSSSAPKSTWHMASARSRCPARWAIWRCISWATHR